MTCQVVPVGTRCCRESNYCVFISVYQSGVLSLLSSVGSEPLQLWGKQVRNGHIKRIIDDEVESVVLEIAGLDIRSTYIVCPADANVNLGIKLPFLVLLVKNLGKDFSLEVETIDASKAVRRFRWSTFQEKPRQATIICTMPMRLSTGWNFLQINLADISRKLYSQPYRETRRIMIHPNCRIRRIFFADRIYAEDDLPREFRLISKRFPLSVNSKTVQSADQSETE
ncbi:Cilia- and flagella-associated protein [Trichinella spiralis]|uniref:Cilia- and flagella-associated protein n=1 Tax=Trichinella spiralis TaxID=6334 RepID=A0ABR3KD89_TRISP